MPFGMAKDCPTKTELLKREGEDYADQSVSERMIVPAVGYKFSDNLSVLAEVVFWDRQAKEGNTVLDRSLNLTLSGHFSASVLDQK